MTYFSIDDQILLNRWAQGIEDDASVLRLFKQWVEQKHDILLNISHLCEQASPCDEHIKEVLLNVPFKPTRSACVLLKKGINAETFFKLRNLKGNDAKDAFWIFLHLFKVADRERKKNESECSHWWHRDLSDPAVIKEVKNKYELGNL